MQVRHILGEKGRDIVAISGDETLSEASRVLAARRIGALIVRGPDGKLLGIISERDVVRAVAQHGAAGVGMKVSQFVSVQRLVSCTSSDTLEHVRHLMNVNHIRHVPVIDDFSLAGVISMRDISSAFDDAATDATQTAA